MQRNAEPEDALAPRAPESVRGIQDRARLCPSTQEWHFEKPPVRHRFQHSIRRSQDSMTALSSALRPIRGGPATCALQLLLGHKNIESTVRYLGIDVDDALVSDVSIIRAKRNSSAPFLCIGLVPGMELKQAIGQVTMSEKGSFPIARFRRCQRQLQASHCASTCI